MSVWFVIFGLVVFMLVWPFVDVGVRNGLKRRARVRQQARSARITDA